MGKYVFVNNQLDAQFFFMYVYFYSLHVSGSHVPIIRRINCINTTFGICYSVQMTVWCAVLDETRVSYLQRLHRDARSTEHMILQRKYVFMCVYIYIYMCVCVCVCVFVCIYICVCVCVWCHTGCKPVSCRSPENYGLTIFLRQYSLILAMNVVFNL